MEVSVALPPWGAGPSRQTPLPFRASLPGLDDKRAPFTPGINSFASAISQEIGFLSVAAKQMLLLVPRVPSMSISLWSPVRRLAEAEMSHTCPEEEQVTPESSSLTLCRSLHSLPVSIEPGAATSF